MQRRARGVLFGDILDHPDQPGRTTLLVSFDLASSFDPSDLACIGAADAIFHVPVDRPCFALPFMRNDVGVFGWKHFRGPVRSNAGGIESASGNPRPHEALVFRCNNEWPLRQCTIHQQ